MTTASQVPTEVQKILEPLGFSACPERTFSLREVGGELKRLTLENDLLRSDLAAVTRDVDIWLDHYLTASEMRATVVAKLEAVKAERSALCSALRDMMNSVEDRDCATAVLKSHPLIAMECPECFGRGSFGGPGSLSEDDPRHEMPEVACDECDGLRWVLR